MTAHKFNRPYSEQEAAFIRLMVPHSSNAAIGAALGSSKAAITTFRYRDRCMYGRKRKPVPLCRAATVEAWRRFQAGEDLRIDLLALWTSDSEDPADRSARGRIWTHGDSAELFELVGTMPVREIAATIKRPFVGVKEQLSRLGISRMPYYWSTANIARRLQAKGFKVGLDAITARCYSFRGQRLRSWREGQMRIVHRDDAEWMVENYEPYEDTPMRNPGAADEEAIYAFIDAHDAMVKQLRKEADPDWLDQEKQLMHRRRGAARTANVNARYKAREQERAA